MVVKHQNYIKHSRKFAVYCPELRVIINKLIIGKCANEMISTQNIISFMQLSNTRTVNVNRLQKKPLHKNFQYLQNGVTILCNIFLSNY